MVMEINVAGARKAVWARGDVEAVGCGVTD
jgi:hypothetical protein